MKSRINGDEHEADPYRQVPYTASAPPPSTEPRLPEHIHLYIHQPLGFPAPFGVSPTEPAPTEPERAGPGRLLRWGGAAAMLVVGFAAGLFVDTRSGSRPAAPVGSATYVGPIARVPEVVFSGRSQPPEPIQWPPLPAATSASRPLAPSPFPPNVAPVQVVPPAAILDQFAQPPRIDPPPAVAVRPAAPRPAPPLAPEPAAVTGPPRNAFGLER